MALDVKSVWAGALTDTSVRVVADTAPPTNGSLLVADNEAMTGAVTLGPVTATAQGILAFTVTGLDADTRYWYVVDAGGLNNSYKGTFRTHPGPAGEPLSYIFGAAGDAGLTGVGDDSHITTAVSNNPVFDTMRAQARAEEWVWFSHLGDLHYRNIATNDVTLFRAAYDDNHNFNLGFNPGARQGQFLRGQAVTYIWDDHDFGPNNSDRTSATNPAANSVYREVVPHYPLPGGATGIYQSWQVGRALYVALDCRSFRDPNSDPASPTKTMLGTGQKAWLEALLSSARAGGAEALVVQSSSRWIGGSDSWSSFTHERDEMVQLFGDTGWRGRMAMLLADEHALSFGSAPYNPYGRFPMYMFASMDSAYLTNSREIYDVGQTQGRQRYGTMRVTDNGHTIALTGTGWINGQAWKSYTTHVPVGTPVIALDYAGGHISPPFEPTEDDQNLRNSVTARRTDGGEALPVTLEEGPLSVQAPPDGVGIYDEAVTVDVATDEQLPSQAGWRVHLGTVDEARYPTVHVDLAANPDLGALLAAGQGGDRVTIANPPEGMPPDTIETIAEGGTELLGAYDWDITLNAAPGTPWRVGELPAGDEATAFPDQPNRADTTGSHLVAAVTDTATELQVHTPPDGTFDRAVWVPAGRPLNTNTSLEVDLTGWQGENATIVRETTPAPAPFPGGFSAKITPDGVSASGGMMSSLSAAGTAVPGESYTVSCWVYSPGGWSDLRASFHWYDAAGTFLITATGAAVAVPAGEWVRLQAT
ncbi:MAG TPA: alkaline phosphatase D family protein, partial [Pseudonocardia sp.]